MLICPNDKNDAVRQLQIALNAKLQICLNPNGVCGPSTVGAIRQFQTQSGLTADGIAGNQTLNALGLTIVHNPITLTDYQTAATVLGVDVPHVRAVSEVETSGRGFLPSGRPAILFERHQFYKHVIIPTSPGVTVAGLIAKRAVFAAANPDICNPSPGGYRGGEAEWDRLNRARAFNDTAALESASFGLFQVMGFNAVSCGYPNVQAFVRDMEASEGDQLEAFIGYLHANPHLIMCLKNNDWAGLAEGYNGLDYTRNRYDEKLAAAYAKYA